MSSIAKRLRRTTAVAMANIHRVLGNEIATNERTNIFPNSNEKQRMMVNQQKETADKVSEDLQILGNLAKEGCDPIDKLHENESSGSPTKTEIMTTTKFPKQPKPALKRRKLGSNNWDKIHEAIQGRKRDALICPTDYQLCPQSMGGGCCPNDRSCGKSSCYLVSTATAQASACGVAGYTACGIDQGGGCCPSGYFCARDACSASPGVSYSQTCGPNSYLCPASLNYGCCQSGMGCGLSDCYSTNVVTYTFTETFTTTSDSHTQTMTSTLVTASTPASPTLAANTSKASAVPKITPTTTAIAKVSPSSSSGTTSTNTGLTKPQIGGIIGGAVIILLVVLVTAFFILIHVKKASKIYKESKSRSRSDDVPRPQPHPQHGPHSPPSEMSSDSRDPFQMRSESEGLEAVSSPSSHTPLSPTAAFSAFSPHSHPFPRTANPARGYHPVATSDSAYSQTSSGYRNPSAESTPPSSQLLFHSYFDPLPLGLRNHNLRHGHDISPIRRPSQHGRNWSDASDVSATSSHRLVELDAGNDGVLKLSLSKPWRVLGLGNWTGRVLSRKKSEGTLGEDRTPRDTAGRNMGGRLEEVEEEAGSFIGAEKEMERKREAVEVDGREKKRKMSWELTQPSREEERPRSGLSNAELREATVKMVGVKGKGRSREINIGRNSKAAATARDEKAEEAGY